MKKSAITLVVLLCCGVLAAQSFEGNIAYQKKDLKAMVIEFPYAPAVVEDAIVEKMEKLGHKKKESKGFLVYKNVVLNDISSEAADYMIKVERKSRREKDESTVYIVMNRGEEDILARKDALVNSNARTFLNNLAPDVEAFNLEREIEAQQNLVAKAEKKLKDLQDDKESMEKKIKNLQDDIKDNVKDQESQQKQIENQKQILESLKLKRKA